MTIDKDEIVRLTEEYGGQWGINHTRRLLSLIELIGKGLEYDHEVVWLAAHLHDWGGYTPWAQKGVDHAVRSHQVAQEFLKEREYPADQTALVLECIATHHSGDPQRCIEAILLSDADGLDFLGIVGILRDFSKNPRNLRAGYQGVQKRINSVPQRLCLDKSKEIAAGRLAQMTEILSAFESDSFGFF